MIPAERVKRILDESVSRDLSSWEKFEFMPNVRKQQFLSKRQEEILSGIERRLFGGSEK
jgi:hypothetical protein